MSWAAGRVTLLAATLIFASSHAGAVRWSVQAATDPSRVAVGGSCQYTVTVTCETGANETPPAFEVSPPAPGAGLVTAGTRFESRRRRGRAWQYVSAWLLTADEIGTVVIRAPRVTAQYADGAQEVRSGPEVTVRVSAGRPASARSGHWRRWPFALIGAAALALVAGARRWRGRPRPVAPDAATTTEVLAGLQAATGHLAADDLPAFFEGLAACLYTYVARAGGSAAATLTTTEAAAVLSRSALPAATQATLIAALRAADEVRFARADWGPDEAWVLVRRLEAVLTQPETAKER